MPDATRERGAAAGRRGEPRLARACDGGSARRFLEVTGSRAALFGSELGVFECWIWPLKVAHDLELSFSLAGGGDPIPCSSVAREVGVTPGELAIRCEHPGFRATVSAFVAPEERAVVLLAEVESGDDLVVSLRLRPDFRPMWPAGMGGQIAARDRETGALLLTEELGRFAALAGSPEADPAPVEADHALPREPVHIDVRVSAERARRGPVVFLVAGAQADPAPLSAAALLGEEDAALGHARAREATARARELYLALARDWPERRAALRSSWRGFLARTARFEGSDPRSGEAFEWAKVAIERAWVEVDGLGRGLVAGLAPSCSGERPGFGWFFDGDALVASRAMTGYGDFDGARRAIQFAASHQRADGKMMHELVLSAGLCDWLGDYPYAYYKAGNTPGFVACLDHHLAGSGDGDLRERMAPHAERAYRFCVACCDEEGLLSNKKAGLAAVEAGPLVGRIRAEVFLQGIWMSALCGIEHLALALGRGELGREARQRLERARSAFERFWCEERGRYGFALLAGGERCDDLTAYLAHPLSRGFGEPERALRSAQRLNEPELASDWGVRLFATGAEGYDPAHYNTGSVFPYANNFAILASYRHGLATAGWQLLRSQVALHGFSGLGLVPEHLRGDRAEAPARGVPHQIFSSSTIVQSILYGMLGLAPWAEERTLVFHPALPPDWERASLEGFRVGASVLDIALERSRVGGRTRLAARFELRQGPALVVFWRPWLPPLSRGLELAFDGGPRLELEVRRVGAALRAHGPGLELAGSAEVVIEGELGPELLLGSGEIEEGRASQDLRLVGVEVDEHSVSWRLAGLRGRSYRVPLFSDRGLALTGARAGEGEIEVEIPAGPPGFGETRVRAEAAP